MITEKQKEWLEALKMSPTPPKHDAEYCVYMSRIQKRIERELESLEWLSKNFPQLFLDEKIFIDSEGKFQPHKRFMTLLQIIMNLNPKLKIIFEKDIKNNAEYLMP